MDFVFKFLCEKGIARETPERNPIEGLLLERAKV
jgi:hypothetical protein